MVWAYLGNFAPSVREVSFKVVLIKKVLGSFGPNPSPLLPVCISFLVLFWMPGA